jgi:hypothetical protein
MKKLLLLALLGMLGAVAARSQSETPVDPGNGSELLQQLKAMTPAQRHEFVAAHPELRQRIRQAILKRYEAMTPTEQQQFAENHPNIAQHLADVSKAGAGVKDPGHPRVNEVNGREEDQQQRITQGAGSGSLTAQQDARLERGEQRIQNQETADMSKNGGNLTAAEQLRLNREQNRESGRIYDDKHDN